MKLFIATLLTLLIGFSASAQGPDKSRVQAIRTSFIADRIHLTPQQAEQFWPVYNRCQTERRAIRHSYLDDNKPGQDREEAQRFLDNNMEYKQKDLAVQKRCNDDYLKVLSPQQAAQLVEAERDFRKMLLDELRDRKQR
ncbi:MAG: hypothetical protein EOP52_06005 [Sphingobacteriales bacterium]|nr:MAG: hypothetical protein EOP52_06005 [Sphingobacteriales bacterium]